MNLPSGDASNGPRSAASLGLATCHACGLLSRVPRPAHAAHCPRCGARVHLRKPDSVARAWALLLTASVLYVPANVLPIMHTGSLYGSQSDTIMSGIVYLWHAGSWDLAVIVFVASIVVPIAKIVAIAVLLVSVQRRSDWQPLQRARLYRWVEFVGKWSMLDVYVVALLATLVHFQGLASITAGAGAVAFGAVVVLTMFAAMAFDPRLIWEPVNASDADVTGRTHG
jgi:paraquat-inducible protein A